VHFEVDTGNYAIETALSNITKPFHNSLWCGISVVAITASIFFVLIEGKNTTDFKGDQLENFWSFWRAELTSMFKAFNGFTGGQKWTPRTDSGRIFAALWTFSCIIMIASYTANLTVVLGTTNLKNSADFKTFCDRRSSG
jgi:hypothetical protein